MVIFKIGLCGFTSCYYFKHHFKQETPAFLFFSTFYALSGFMAAYNWNVMWLDCIFLAPIVLLGLEQLVKKRKYKLYCLTLAFAILSNFYLCIMLCIYLVLYFFIVLLQNVEHKLTACRDFFLFSLLSGGMAAVLLLPEMAALSISEFSSASFPKESKSYFDLFDVLARHCMDTAVETGLDHWPNIYCGVAVLVLLPLYVICKNIPVKEKITKLGLLGFLLLSFSSNILTFLWHGLNYPNSLPSRQSYLYILLLLTLCAEAFLHIKEFTKTELSYIFFACICYLLLCQKLITDDAFTDRTFLLTGLFLCGYAVLLYLYHRQSLRYRSLLFLFLLLFMSEAGLNTYLTSCPTVSRQAYLEDHDSYPVLIQYSTEKFERFERDKRVTSNDGTLHGYPSASCFSSTINGLATAFYEKYGLRSSKVHYTADGMTPFTAALLNTAYTIGTSDSEKKISTPASAAEGNLSLYKNPFSLPFGYAVSADLLNFSEDRIEEEWKDSLSVDPPEVEEGDKALEELFIDSEYAPEVVSDDELAASRAYTNPLENQNRLAQKLGADEDLFSSVSVKNEHDTAVIKIEKDGHYYAYSGNKKVAQAEVRVSSSDGAKIEEMTYKKLTNRYILDLGERKQGERILVTAQNGKEIRLSAFLFNEAPFSSLLETLNTQPFEISSFSSTRIEGSIKVQTPGYVVFSLPYEPGWKVTIDGNIHTPQLLEGMFLSVPITEGSHEICLTYLPNGFTAGCVISSLSLFLFLLYCFIHRKK